MRADVDLEFAPFYLKIIRCFPGVAMVRHEAIFDDIWYNFYCRRLGNSQNCSLLILEVWDIPNGGFSFGFTHHPFTVHPVTYQRLYLLRKQIVCLTSEVRPVSGRSVTCFRLYLVLNGMWSSSMTVEPPGSIIDTLEDLVCHTSIRSSFVPQPSIEHKYAASWCLHLDFSRTRLLQFGVTIRIFTCFVLTYTSPIYMGESTDSSI